MTRFSVNAGGWREIAALLSAATSPTAMRSSGLLGTTRSTVAGAGAASGDRVG